MTGRNPSMVCIFREIGESSHEMLQKNNTLYLVKAAHKPPIFTTDIFPQRIEK